MEEKSYVARGDSGGAASQLGHSPSLGWIWVRPRGAEGTAYHSLSLVLLCTDCGCSSLAITLPCILETWALRTWRVTSVTRLSPPTPGWGVLCT